MAVLNSWQKIDTSIPGYPWGTGLCGNQTINANCDYKVTDAPVGILANCFGLFSGTAGNSTGTYTEQWGFSGSYMSNGDIVLLFQVRGTGASQWEIKRIVSGLGTGTLTFDSPLHYSYTTGAQIIRAPMMNNITVNPGVTVSSYTWGGHLWGGVIFMVARNSITINGSLSVAGRGYLGGSQNASNGNFVGLQGEGHPGARDSRSTAANGTGGGGGGANNSPGGGGGGGGGGGNGGGGANGAGAGFAGGTGGAADLTTMIFGGGGGGGGNDDAGGFPGAAGGNGGGIIILYSKQINVPGSMNMNGNNGSNYVAEWGGAGGGGAGGSGLFVCEYGNFGTLITANGASGGSASANSRGTGGAGGGGRIAIHHRGTATGSTSPTFTDVTDSTLFEPQPTYNYLQDFKRMSCQDGLIDYRRGIRNG